LMNQVGVVVVWREAVVVHARDGECVMVNRHDE
jgi:hypothetical protein